MDKQPEVVRIGVGSARLTRVTPLQVEYVDEAGEEHFIDLQECAQNWIRHFDENRARVVAVPGVSSESIAQWNARCIGSRGALSDPPWVVLMSEPSTRFEFKNYFEVHELLLVPLMEVGWHTFDSD